MKELYPNCFEETLSNGLKILFESRPGRPLSAGVWVRIGSRDETEKSSGISHFLEHMVFKGTRHRTAFQISEEIDALGGYINAMTSKEYTAYYVDVLPQHLEKSMDVLTDLIKTPLFQPEELEKEKGVVLEEIRMQEDSPSDKVFDLFTERLWESHHPLSRPIIGDTGTVSSFSRDDVVKHFSLYDASRITLAVAGEVDAGQLVEVAERQLGKIPAKSKSLPKRISPKPKASTHLEDRDLQQAHICLGTPGLARSDSRRFALETMTTILGGGMSSRLFKRIREELGLAYAVSGQASYYSDSGFVVIYLGTEPKNASKALEVCHEEIARIQNEPVPAETLWLAKEKLKGNLLLGLESSHSRMIRLGIADIYNTQWPVEEVIGRIEAVTIDDVQQVARDVFASEAFTLAVVGPQGQLASIQPAIPVS